MYHYKIRRRKATFKILAIADLSNSQKVAAVLIPRTVVCSALMRGSGTTETRILPVVLLLLLDLARTRKQVVNSII